MKYICIYICIYTNIHIYCLQLNFLLRSTLILLRFTMLGDYALSTFLFSTSLLYSSLLFQLSVAYCRHSAVKLNLKPANKFIDAASKMHCYSLVQLLVSAAFAALTTLLFGRRICSDL